jgi:hypothetical protein
MSRIRLLTLAAMLFAAATTNPKGRMMVPELIFTRAEATVAEYGAWLFKIVTGG